MLDFILNGVASGGVAAALLAGGMDPLALRPWVGEDGRTYITQNQNGKLVSQLIGNTGGLLRRDDWIQFDEAIVKAALPRLRAVSDIRGAGLQLTIPGGLGKTVLATERQSDVGAAITSMDGLREGENDRPVFDIQNLPLPIIHKDFSFSLRQIMASRNGGSPLDTTMAELCGRKVAETAEQLLLGTAASYAFGGGTIYGLTNFPSRITKGMTDPTAGGWTPKTTVDEVLSMKLKAAQKYHFGPFMLYASLDWDPYLDDDYKSTYNETTLRQRLRLIDGIQDVRTLDFLPVHTMVLVQMTSDVVREVVGMDITTVQWETKGGMQVNFKVMAIMVPQVRADFNGNTGIVHGSY